MKKKRYKYLKNKGNVKKKNTSTMYIHKNNGTKYKVMTVVFLLLLLFASAYLTKHRNTFTVVERLIKDSVLTLENWLERPLRYIHNEQKENQEQKDLYKNYKDLEKKFESMQDQNIQLLELKEQVKQLQASLDLHTILNEVDMIHATVIYKDSLQNTITIDKGRKQGLETGLAVMIKEGMIGIIDEVSDVTSTIQLLTSYYNGPKMSVKIQVQDGFVYGLLTGYQENKKTYKIEEIASNQGIEEKSVVLTSGMGSKIPSGIVIGYVKSVTKDHFDLGQLVEVESKASYDHLDYVTVVKRKG